VALAALVVVGAAAAWQFLGKRDNGAAADTAATAASASLPAVVAAPSAIVVPPPSIAAPTTAAQNPVTAPPATATTSPTLAPAPSLAATPTTQLPDEPRAVPAPPVRAPTTAARTEVPFDATARPAPANRVNPSFADRNGATVDRQNSRADNAGMPMRPVGRPVPRAGEGDATVNASMGNPNMRPADSPSFTTSNGNSSERPRPLGSPALRELPNTSRPVPTQVPAARPMAPPPLQANVGNSNGPASAREACGKRVFIALAVCMDDRCEEPRFRNTEECVGILARKHARENR
jgi:hypothetical protein